MTANQTPRQSSASKTDHSSAIAFIFPALALLTGCLIFFLFSRSVAETRLELKSTPSGATVFLNGRLAGATPLNLTGLKPGTYSVRLEKEGFAPSIQKVQLEGSVLVDEELPRFGTGVLSVAIKQKGAEVLLDGEFIGHTPLRRDDIPAGVHELQIRKTNFEPYVARVVVEAGQLHEYSGFPLEDKIRTMLQAAIDQDKQRVSNYMDLAHYLFMNDELDQAAETYVRALQVAAAPIVFDPAIDAAERILQTRLRNEDTHRLNDEIKKKKNWANKDVARFKTILDKQQETIANSNPGDWPWVAEQADNFVRQDKLDRAESLYVQHIAVAKGIVTLPQAYIQLLTLRLRMRNLDKSRETYEKFSELYGNRPELLRQAGNAIYGQHTSFEGEARMEVLTRAEKLLSRGAKLTQKQGDGELNALCKFELANVLMLQGRADVAAPYYQESVDGTRDATTRELRNQRLAECYKSLGKTAEARHVLEILAGSPRETISAQAKADLKQLEASKPSPENK
jgi:tetratricopeptide (TPR) repeat protein